jgi:glycosyltransferase involved in cell wall biosynthesis
LHVVFFGTYDTHRPRFRILTRGLAQAGVTVSQCHASIWGDLEDRSHMRDARNYLRPALRWCAAMPRLARAYAAIPPHDAVIVPYLGQADAVAARRLVRKRGAPLIFDPYVSLFETVIGDRKLAPSRSLAAHAIRLLDVRAFKAADLVVVDTASHGDLIADQLRLGSWRRHVIPVGAEADVFVSRPLPAGRSTTSVLFYGSMIPLHGIETIVRAAAGLRDRGSVRFTVIGTGQEHAKARALAAQLNAGSIIEWRDRVPYDLLPSVIAEADICLGIFGTTRKAHAVVPNKVYQALAVGRPVVSADTPAMREWFTPGVDCLLTRPGDHHQLGEAIVSLIEDRALRERLAHDGHRLFAEKFSEAAIGEAARAMLTASSPLRCAGLAGGR